MMQPNINTIWRYIGPGVGQNDIQRVIGANQQEVVTISERESISQIDFSGLFPTQDFPKLFQFIQHASS